MGAGVTKETEISEIDSCRKGEKDANKKKANDIGQGQGPGAPPQPSKRERRRAK